MDHDGETALRSRDRGTALDTGDVQSLEDERVISLIISTLGENPLLTIQDSTTTKADWNKIHISCSRKTVPIKLGLLQTLFNLRKEEVKDMGNHISLLESQFS